MATLGFLLSHFLALWLILGKSLVVLAEGLRASGALAGQVGLRRRGVVDGPKDVVHLRLSEVSQLSWDILVGLSRCITEQFWRLDPKFLVGNGGGIGLSGVVENFRRDVAHVFK